MGAPSDFGEGHPRYLRRIDATKVQRPGDFVYIRGVSEPSGDFDSSGEIRCVQGVNLGMDRRVLTRIWRLFLKRWLI